MEEKNPVRNFDLTSFKRANEQMVKKNTATFDKSYFRFREYTPKEISEIISSGSLVEQQKLSRNYFNKDGFYKRIILHYATLLKYVGVLIPNPSFGNSLSASHISKRYYNAIDFLDKISLPTFLSNCATRALIDGSYFGIIKELDKKSFVVFDLPSGYCRSRFKDLAGNDIIEFDLSYFNSILDKDEKKSTLKVYPEFVSKAYKEWNKGKGTSSWLIIPSNIGVCFTFFDGHPLFLNVIPATIQYDEAIETESARDKEEIKKIIVQKVPHLSDGRLLFEPEEAEEMHSGAVGMMKGNPNVSVLTTYADVDAIVSKTSADSTSNNLEKMMHNIYYQSGTSSQIFSSNGSNTIETSLNNDLSLMMYLANKFSFFITQIINEVFGNSNISFKYQILPITYYNADKFADTSFKLASSGYSFLMPALAMGISQKDLSNLKDLENDVLNLKEKLLPLTSSYTQGSEGSAGAPKKEGEEKSDKTIQNEESLDNQA